MVRAEMDGGQVLLALNEVFIGHASHQSARYSLRHAGQEETQSSSGLIVASGTGATGWALSIGRATGVAVDLSPGEPAAMFLVREPWPSQATGVGLSAGRLARDDKLIIVSRMNQGGVVFADGMEGDRLDFAWGRTLQVSVADRQLRFVPGAVRPQPAPPIATRSTKPIATRSSKSIATRSSKPITTRSAEPVPSSLVQRSPTRRTRRLPSRRLLWLLLILAVIFWLAFTTP